MPSSRAPSQPRGQTQVSSIAGGLFTIWATREVYLFSSGFSWPRNQTEVSHIGGGFFTSWATREMFWQMTYKHKHRTKQICIYYVVTVGYLKMLLQGRNGEVEINWIAPMRVGFLNPLPLDQCPALGVRQSWSLINVCSMYEQMDEWKNNW